MAETLKVGKTFNQSYYSTAWFYNDVVEVELDGTLVTEDIDSSSGNVIIPRPKSKSNWLNGIKTTLTDLLNVNHQLTFQGSFGDERGKVFGTTTLVSIVGTDVTVNDATAFPSADGLIQIEDELIYYATKSGNVFSTCRRGHAHTVNVSHSAGVDVDDMTDSAIDKKYQIEQLRTRGGTIYIYWRNFRYEGMATKMSFKDTKTTDTGGKSRVTKFTTTITFRVCELK